MTPIPGNTALDAFVVGSTDVSSDCGNGGKAITWLPWRHVSKHTNVERCFMKYRGNGVILGSLRLIEPFKQPCWIWEYVASDYREYRAIDDRCEVCMVFVGMVVLSDSSTVQGPERVTEISFKPVK